MCWNRVGWTMVVALAMGGCGGDDEADSGKVGSGDSTATADDDGSEGEDGSEGDDGPVTATDDGTSEGDSEGEGDSSSDDESSGGDIDSFEDCRAFVGFDIACEEPGDHAWVAYGEAFGCVGAIGHTGVIARVLFRLDETVDGEPQLRGLRLGPETPAPTDEIIQWNAPAPVPYASWTTEVAWPLELEQMTLAGGLSFLVGRTNDATIELAGVPPLQTLMDGTELQGTYAWTGGEYDILQADESIATIPDATAQGIGCFRVSAELYPLELED